MKFNNKKYILKLDTYDIIIIILLLLLLLLLIERLSLLTMTNLNQVREVLLFVCSKVAEETTLSSKLPIADNTRGLRKKALLVMP